MDATGLSFSDIKNLSYRRKWGDAPLPSSVVLGAEVNTAHSDMPLIKLKTTSLSVGAMGPDLRPSFPNQLPIQKTGFSVHDEAF
jgi:hypothetical protein